MAIKFHYDAPDDVFTIWDDEHRPSETIEFSEFLNIDLDKKSNIVGLEFFWASEFFGLTNNIVNKEFLENISNVRVDSKNYRNTYWIISLIFDYKGQVIKIQLPPLRKSEYVSPLIAYCNQ